MCGENGRRKSIRMLRRIRALNLFMFFISFFGGHRQSRRLLDIMGGFDLVTFFDVVLIDVVFVPDDYLDGTWRDAQEGCRLFKRDVDQRLQRLTLMFLTLGDAAVGNEERIVERTLTSVLENALSAIETVTDVAIRPVIRDVELRRWKVSCNFANTDDRCRYAYDVLSLVEYLQDFSVAFDVDL